MVNGLQLYSAFLTTSALQLLPNIHPFMHTVTHRLRCQHSHDNQLVGGVRCLTQGHLDTQLGGAGDRTCDLPVASRATLPPQPMLPSQCGAVKASGSSEEAVKGVLLLRRMRYETWFWVKE